MIIYPHKPSESATDYAYRVLQKNIIQMLLPPGTAIRPVEVASELNISRTPLQSACSRLATDGLITIFPQKGSYVALIDIQRVYESVYMRNILEQAAVRQLCVSDRFDDAICALEANINQQEFSLKINATDEIIKLDNKFHSIIYEMSGMSNIQNALTSISADQDRVRYMKMQSNIRMHDTVKEHTNLLNAIKSRDQNLASMLSYKHVSQFGIDIISVYEQTPAYFYNLDENLLSHFVCKEELFYNMIKI